MPQVVACKPQKHTVTTRIKSDHWEIWTVRWSHLGVVLVHPGKHLRQHQTLGLEFHWTCGMHTAMYQVLE